jgi:WD40 repeat protein
MTISDEAETICLPSGLKFVLQTPTVCPTKVCRQLPGKQIVSASIDNNLKLWDLAGNCLQTFVGHTAGVWSANFTPTVCPTKVCRQLPAKSQSLRLLSIEAETICLPSGLKFALQSR